MWLQKQLVLLQGLHTKLWNGERVGVSRWYLENRKNTCEISPHLPRETGRVTLLFPALSTRLSLRPTNGVDDICFYICSGESSGSQIQAPEHPSFVQVKVVQLSLWLLGLSFLYLSSSWWPTMAGWCFTLYCHSTHSIVIVSRLDSHGAYWEPLT